MINLHYTPAELALMTIPQFMCLLSDEAAGEKKLESMAEFSKVVAERKQADEDWSAPTPTGPK